MRISMSPGWRYAKATVIAGVIAAGLSACGSSSTTSSTASVTTTQQAAAADTSNATGPPLLSGTMKCGATPTGDDPCKLPATAPNGKALKIMFSYWQNNTYSQAAYDAAKAYGAKYNATIVGVTNPTNAAAQLSQLQDAVSSNAYDGYIVEPNDPTTIRAVLTKAIQAGKPVAAFTLTNGTDNKTAKIQLPGQTLQISNPPYADGQAMGQMTIHACANVNPCQVAFIRGAPSIPFDSARYQGFKDTIASVSSIKLVATGVGGYSIAGGQKAAQDILQAHPDVNVIATLSDQETHGTEMVLQREGKASKVKITGAGGSEYGIQAVRDGRWYGDSILLPADEGQLSALAVIAAARGQKMSLGINSGLMSKEVPPYLDETNKSAWPPASFKGQWSGS